MSTSTAAPLHKYSGMLRVACNPSAAVQSPDGLVLYFSAFNRYYYNHHQMMVEFFCLNRNTYGSLIQSPFVSLTPNRRVTHPQLSFLFVTLHLSFIDNNVTTVTNMHACGFTGIVATRGNLPPYHLRYSSGNPSQQILASIIKSQEEKKELKMSPETRKQVSYTDMRETRTLEKDPEVRTKLLDMRAKKEISRDDLGKISKEISKIKEPEIQKKVVEKIRTKELRNLLHKMV